MAANELIPWINSAGEGGVRNSMQEFPGAGTNGPFEFNFAGGTIDPSYVKAYRYDPVSALTYTQTLTFVGPNQVTTSDVIPVGQFVVVYRDTPKDQPLVDYSEGAVMDEANLDKSNQQAVFIAAEMLDRFDAINATSSDAINRSVQALNTANEALADAEAAQLAAATAVSTANSASTKADGAVMTANDASTTAHGIDAKAQTALDNSTAAVSTANAANATANGIDAKATQAMSDASAAVSTANGANSNATTALQTANGIDAKATQALSEAGSAQTNAANAVTAANIALAQTTNLINNQCRLVWDGTNITLLPWNGRNILINGTVRQLPIAGVQLSPAWAGSALQTYLVYAAWNGTAVILEASATARVLDATLGMWVKSGDATRTCVGVVICSTVNTWTPLAGIWPTCSLFNRQRMTIPVGVPPNTALTTSNNGLAAVSVPCFVGDLNVMDLFADAFSDGSQTISSAMYAANATSGAPALGQVGVVLSATALSSGFHVILANSGRFTATVDGRWVMQAQGFTSATTGHITAGVVTVDCML